tara:strand:- start:2565 stop:3014 length:450 start_codon:yes stop_codon:yes gene_type:complete
MVLAKAKKTKATLAKKAKATKSAAPPQTTFIAKIAKKYLGAPHERDSKGNITKKNLNKLTFSREALTEVELLMNHAIARLVENGDAVLEFNGASTFGASTAQTAAKLALSGLLLDDAVKAGTQAIVNYNNYAVGAPPVPNVTEKPVAAQ